jgi:hypothetical protein
VPRVLIRPGHVASHLTATFAAMANPFVRHRVTLPDGRPLVWSVRLERNSPVTSRSRVNSSTDGAMGGPSTTTNSAGCYSAALELPLGPANAS